MKRKTMSATASRYFVLVSFVRLFAFFCLFVCNPRHLYESIAVKVGAHLLPDPPCHCGANNADVNHTRHRVEMAGHRHCVQARKRHVKSAWICRNGTQRMTIVTRKHRLWCGTQQASPSSVPFDHPRSSRPCQEHGAACASAQLTQSGLHRRPHGRAAFLALEPSATGGVVPARRGRGKFFDFCRRLNFSFL
jgi:hypothetical protein